MTPWKMLEAANTTPQQAARALALPAARRAQLTSRAYWGYLGSHCQAVLARALP
jgi:hypothetical protein